MPPDPVRPDPITLAPSLTDLCRRIETLASQRAGQRIIIGIVGAPGSGKTTLAEALVAALVPVASGGGSAGAGGGGGGGGGGGANATSSVGPSSARQWIGSRVAHVPMDGFHLADVELHRLGRADRKGAPDTFDPAGYAALLHRIRTTSDVIWAPGFDREVEQPIAGSIPVLAAARVIITEGNYLLLDQPSWRSAREQLDEVWFCDLDEDVRRRRLIARHIRFGKTPVAAELWANGPDQRNAELINATRTQADLVISEVDGTNPS